MSNTIFLSDNLMYYISTLVGRQEALILTSVISVKVCRPELSWIVLMATGIFTVSPSGVQNPLNKEINKKCSKKEAV